MSGQEDNGAVVDLLFIQDTTESMTDYMRSARDSIVEICSLLAASGRVKYNEGLQMGLLAYGDYPAKENELVVDSYPFTFDLDVMEGYLAALTVKPGHDLPEAFSTALHCAYTEKRAWRDEALKVIIIVTDAAPHGIQEKGDNFPNGAPEGIVIRDPLELARHMVDEGYTIFTLGCEPQLGRTTQYAVDFYKALSDRTLGSFYSLTDHKLLATYIIGSLLERIDLKDLSNEYQEFIVQRVVKDGCSIDAVIDELQEKLTSENQHVTTLQTGNIYNDSAVARHNYEAFMSSDTLADAKKSLKRVFGACINADCQQIIRRTSSNGQQVSPFSMVTVRIRNLGTERVVLKLYDAEARRLCEDMIVPDNFVLVKQFTINSPINFVLQCGSKSKNYSRSFDKEQDFDVYHIFNFS